MRSLSAITSLGIVVAYIFWYCHIDASLGGFSKVAIPSELTRSGKFRSGRAASCAVYSTTCAFLLFHFLLSNFDWECFVLPCDPQQVFEERDLRFDTRGGVLLTVMPRPFSFSKPHLLCDQCPTKEQENVAKLAAYPRHT